MDYTPRPYKGRATELAELDAFTKSATKEDTVIEAGKKCLLIGGLTAPFLIGGPFLTAAFVMGIYAMATNRMKQGLKISLLAIIFLTIIPITIYILSFGIMAAIMSAVFSSIPQHPLR